MSLFRTRRKLCAAVPTCNDLLALGMPTCRCAHCDTIEAIYRGMSRPEMLDDLNLCSICFNPHSRCTCVANGYR